jgi:hypothetical protein
MWWKIFENLRLEGEPKSESSMVPAMACFTPLLET